MTRRSNELKLRVLEALAQTGAPKVHIIAHSMGGLDARHMIVDLEMADRVASLTTIGTPHRGTVLADHALSNGGVLLMDVLKRVVDVDGFVDLTITSCEEFNRRAEDQEARNDVAYQAYASAEDFRRVFAPLLPSWLFIRDHEGRNDGLVPFGSQQWTKEMVASDGRRKAIVAKGVSFSGGSLESSRLVGSAGDCVRADRHFETGCELRGRNQGTSICRLRKVRRNSR